MTIPVRTNRLHLKPYWLGDSPRAIDRCALRRPGNRFIDVNFTVCKDGVVAAHWSTPGKNGYDHIFVRHRRNRAGRLVEVRRALTYKEKNTPLSQLPVAFVLKLRRTLHPGTSYESRVRIYTFEEMIAKAKTRRVTICAELKSQGFATNPDWAKRMRRSVVARNTTVYPMALVTMAYWGQKLKNFRQAGFETALLAHDAPKPKDLATWMPYISRIWGQWR